MEQNKALEIVEKHLTKQRYEHTVRVMETAIKLAEYYGADIKKVEIAAIFHDYAKYRQPEEMKRWIISERLPQDLLDYHPELWHAPVGSRMVEREIGITDSEIQSAIYWHTTGTRYMNLIEQIIFIADYIEPGREFSGVDEVRDAAYQDIGQACWIAAKNTIQYLMARNQPVYPDTFQLYNGRTIK